MVRIGSFVRVKRDCNGDEPLVQGMVGKVVADVYGRADPAAEALVVIAGARKACTVPLDAVEVISEADYGDEAVASRGLWKERRKLWKKRHGAAAPRREEHAGDDEEENDEEEGELAAGPSDDLLRAPGAPPAETSDGKVHSAELIRRAEAVEPAEISGLASPAMLAILTEWSVGALDILADNIASFAELPYGRAREVRGEHVERWLWDGVRLYLAVRSLHAGLLPVQAESARERVRSLFERIDDGEAAERLAAFSLDVAAVKEALSSLSAHWLDEALEDFAGDLTSDEPARRELGRYILQLHIVGFQVGFCADSANHGRPAN